LRQGSSDDYSCDSTKPPLSFGCKTAEISNGGHGRAPDRLRFKDALKPTRAKVGFWVTDEGE